MTDRPNRCTNGPGGTPCGNFSERFQDGQCRQCWRCHHYARRFPLRGEVGAKPRMSIGDIARGKG